MNLLKVLAKGLGTLSISLWLGGCATEPAADRRASAVDSLYPLVSPGQQFLALPPAVRNSIRAQAGSTDIREIEVETTAAGTVYVVHFERDSVPNPLRLASDGRVLNPDLTTARGAAAETLSQLTGAGQSDVSLADLPGPVIQTLKERAAEGRIRRINKETWGERTVYNVTFEDPENHPALYISSDGTLVDTSAD